MLSHWILPYKLIAADANNSESVTTLDLIVIRRVILSIEDEFTNNTSWRFVDASYNFPNPANPWTQDFPEVINENDLQEGINDGRNFTAVKIGDVNNSAQANALMEIEDRNSGDVFAFDVKDEALKVGNQYTVDFKASDIDRIDGYQLTLNFDNSALELSDIVYGAATENNFGLRFVDEGVITTSWNGEAGTDEILFSLVFTTRVDAQLSDLLSVSSRYTNAEAYNGAGETMDVAINFGTGTVATAGFELYQNTPNPFKGETLIGFNLPQEAAVTIRIHDVNGKALKLIRGDFAKGYNSIDVTSAELPAIGLLYYTVETAEFSATKKMIILE